MGGELPLQPIYGVLYVQAAGSVRITLRSHRLQDIVRDIPDKTVPAAVQRSRDRSASGVSQHHDMPALEMARRVLYAPQLVIVSTFPATRITNSSPMEAEKICSGITLESEQHTTMA